MYQYYNSLIPQPICKDLIFSFNNLPSTYQKKWGDRDVSTSANILLQNKRIIQILFFLNTLASRNTNNILFPEWVEIVMWPQGSFQDPHNDTARNSTKYTSISYLNNNYKGGKTFFTSDNSMSKNNVGDTIMFDGVKHEHGVKPITKGSRYVLAVWYSDNINDFILNW